MPKRSDQKNIDCVDLSIWDLVKVAYQIGGKWVTYSTNGAGIIILGQKVTYFSPWYEIKSGWTKDLNTIFYINIHAIYYI